MSEKFKVVDHATFERMQQSQSSKSDSTALPKIRNSKYKRMTAIKKFNLLQFVKAKDHCLGKKIRKRVIDVRIAKNKGKKRETGVKKKPTRLKKSILLYRKKKRQQDQIEKQLAKSQIDLINLKLDNGKNEKIIPSIHSNNFREYCNCCKTPDLRKHCEQLIRELNHFQRRAYAQNEIKARAHKRFVVGFRQVQAYLHINKIKLAIIATDCERNDGGEVCLDETIENIKKICNDQQIPIVFAFRRREMAYIIYKKASISCIGILDYDGAREVFSQLIAALQNARKMYESMIANIK